MYMKQSQQLWISQEFRDFHMVLMYWLGNAQELINKGVAPRLFVHVMILWVYLIKCGLPKNTSF